MDGECSSKLTPAQQHHANRNDFSKLLPLAMNRTQQRNEQRRLSFQKIREGFLTSAALADALGEGFSAKNLARSY